MLYLYHGTTSVCAIKVRLVLAEKRLDWDGEILDLQRGDQHRPAYLALNPNGVVPTLVHDGAAVVESSVIMQYLEDVFPDVPLVPPAPLDRARMRLWMKRVDEVLHAAIGVVTFATANRKILIRKSPEELAAHFARIPDPVYRERQRQSVELGLQAPQVEGAIRSYERAFAGMEAALSDSAYLAGDGWSLADAAVTPYVNRAAMLGMDEMWRGRRPKLEDWFARMRGRPSFAPSVTDALTAADRERFDIPRDETAARVRNILENA